MRNVTPSQQRVRIYTPPRSKGKNTGSTPKATAKPAVKSTKVVEVGLGVQPVSNQDSPIPMMTPQQIIQSQQIMANQQVNSPVVEAIPAADYSEALEGGICSPTIREEDLPGILTAREVGAYLGVSRTTAYEIMKKMDEAGIVIKALGPRLQRVTKKAFLNWIDTLYGGQCNG